MVETLKLLIVVRVMNMQHFLKQHMICMIWLIRPILMGHRHKLISARLITKTIKKLEILCRLRFTKIGLRAWLEHKYLSYIFKHWLNIIVVINSPKIKYILYSLSVKDFSKEHFAQKPSTKKITFWNLGKIWSFENLKYQILYFC